MASGGERDGAMERGMGCHGRGVVVFALEGQSLAWPFGLSWQGEDGRTVVRAGSRWTPQIHWFEHGLLQLSDFAQGLESGLFVKLQ